MNNPSRKKRKRNFEPLALVLGSDLLDKTHRDSKEKKSLDVEEVEDTDFERELEEKEEEDIFSNWVSKKNTAPPVTLKSADKVETFADLIKTRLPPSINRCKQIVKCFQSVQKLSKEKPLADLADVFIRVDYTRDWEWAASHPRLSSLNPMFAEVFSPIKKQFAEIERRWDSEMLKVRRLVQFLHIRHKLNPKQKCSLPFYTNLRNHDTKKARDLILNMKGWIWIKSTKLTLDQCLQIKTFETLERIAFEVMLPDDTRHVTFDDYGSCALDIQPGSNFNQRISCVLKPRPKCKKRKIFKLDPMWFYKEVKDPVDLYLDLIAQFHQLGILRKLSKDLVTIILDFAFAHKVYTPFSRHPSVMVFSV